ncbi:MAG: tetratricopeptide repeat protein [Actinophytocola sp.]|uniref:tetratricopeptide repeat protein n=1 Tax=Actinophytocola sp. TaxID=1872138 RepID=UPI003C775CCA
MFGILGRTALLLDGALQDNWGKPRERAVLGALLVHAGRWVPVDTLIEWAWPEEKAQPQNIGPTFHTYATRVRKWLRQLPTSPSLDGGGGSYRLDIDKSLIDYYRFTALLREARTHAKQQDSRQAAESARHALDLWRGRPLDDLAGEPARAWRLRVEQDDWLGANRTLLAALLDLNLFDEVLTRIGELQTDHPGDVAFATQRMSALHGLRRYEDETAYYFTVRRRLQHDGDEPAMEHVRQHHEGLRTPDGGGSNLAPRSPDPVIVPRQLRHDVADFVGRDDLLAELDGAVTDREGRVTSGVVVIDGMAGVGKTALVTHWGHRTRRRFPDGDLYVNLNGFAEDASASQATVVDDLLIAVGYPPDADLTGRARELLLTRLLSGRRMLVVLDNARDAKHVEHLVTLLPDALVLVTSRQQLVSLSATTSARRVQVDPMTPAEATALLSMRLGTRREMTRGELARLAALCGGLPLMISLLAAHIATRPAGQMLAFAEQLDGRQLIVDVGEDGDAVTAQTFFTWSYRALDPPEQRLFRLLGLHPATHFNIHAAGALDGRSRAETTRSIRALVGAHLVERAATALDRYQLHDLVREFAAHRAESDEPVPERQAATRRLASFYLASAVHASHTLYPSRLAASELAVERGVEPVVPTDSAQAKEWFDLERANLLAMIRNAAATGHHDHAWRLTDAAVIFFDRHGYYEDSLAAQKIATSSAQEASDRVGEASSLVGLGRVYLTIGEHREARRHLDTALRIVDDIGHEAGQAAVLGLLGKLETQRGDLTAALALYRRGLKIAQKNDDAQGLCWTSCRIGEVLRAIEQHDEALVHLTRAQILAERSGDQSAHASTLIEIGRVHHDRGDHSTAAAHCEQALRAAEAIPDLAVSQDACIALAEINKARGHIRGAIEFTRRAIRMSGYSTAAHAHDVLGDVHYANADMTAATAAWQEAVEHYNRLGNLPQATVVHAKLARIPRTDVLLPRARSASSPPISTTADHHDQKST